MECFLVNGVGSIEPSIYLKHIETILFINISIIGGVSNGPYTVHLIKSLSLTDFTVVSTNHFWSIRLFLSSTVFKTCYQGSTVYLLLL